MYLDPGFGSMIIQIIVGAIAAGGAVLFTMRQRVGNFFGFLSRKNKKNNSEELENNENE